MKNLIFLIFSFSFAVSMEQPRIAVLDTYKLKGNKGSEVTFAGNLVRELLPGLAAQFRLGMKEAAGTIFIHNLDQEGLQVLKRWLNKIYPSQQQLEKKILEIKSDTDKQIKNTVFPEQEKRREVDEKNKIIENANKQMEQAIFEMVSYAKSELEAVPGIGEHFLEIFNNLIKWNAHLIIAEAAGLFAAEQLDFSNDHTFTQLQLLDPEAQLLYLFRVEYTLENIYRAYEWFKILKDTPTIVAQENNRNVLDAVAQKLIAFTAAHIEDILKKYPLFKNLFTKPEFVASGKLLRAELIKKSSEYFTTIIRPAKQGERTESFVHHKFDPNSILVSYLGDTSTALHDASVANNIYDFKTNVFKSLKWLSSTQTSSQVIWGPNRIIFYGARSFDVYDINTGKKIFTPTMTEPLQIEPLRQLLPITHDQLLLVDNAKNVYKLTIKEDKTYSIEQMLANTISIILINEHEFIAAEQYKDAIRLTLRKISKGDLVKELLIPGLANYSLSFLKKINSNTLGMVLTPAPGDAVVIKYVIVSFADLKLASMVDFAYTYRPDHSHTYRFIPVNTSLILIKELSSWPNRPTKMYLYNVETKNSTPLERYNSAVVPDTNYLAAYDKKTNNFVIEFIPQGATLIEILNEIQRKIALQQPVQPQQVQKRPAPVQIPEEAIPAAAKGLRPAGREIKRPREEKEKPNG